ncbi:multidrug resistance associated protein7, partial [Zea mays]
GSAVSCRFPHPQGQRRPTSATQKRRTPFRRPNLPLPRSPSPAAAPSYARTHRVALYLLPRAAGRLLNRRRCCWDCSVGGPCSEEGVRRRRDCSRDELRRQQLPRIRCEEAVRVRENACGEAQGHAQGHHCLAPWTWGQWSQV